MKASSLGLRKARCRTELRIAPGFVLRSKLSARHIPLFPAKRQQEVYSGGWLFTHFRAYEV